MSEAQQWKEFAEGMARDLAFWRDRARELESHVEAYKAREKDAKEYVAQLEARIWPSPSVSNAKCSWSSRVGYDCELSEGHDGQHTATDLDGKSKVGWTSSHRSAYQRPRTSEARPSKRDEELDAAYREGWREGAEDAQDALCEPGIHDRSQCVDRIDRMLNGEPPAYPTTRDEAKAVSRTNEAQSEGFGTPPPRTTCERPHWVSPGLRCSLGRAHNGACLYSVEAVLAACQPPTPRAETPKVTCCDCGEMEEPERVYCTTCHVENMYAREKNTRRKTIEECAALLDKNGLGHISTLLRAMPTGGTEP